MEQYYLPKKNDIKNLEVCVASYTPLSLRIRDCGGTNPDGSYRAQGLEKVSIDLKGHKLDFKKDTRGLHVLVDAKDVFVFPLEDYDKGLSIMYERLIMGSDKIGRLHMPSTGAEPYDPNLPEPQKTTLRHLLDNHLIEITYPGRIHIKFHSWWEKPLWKYWTIIPPKETTGDATPQPKQKSTTTITTSRKKTLS